jgi:hypothetical protein
MSPDDPFIGQDPNDPQSWNLYSYVNNNPLTNIDPDGHDCVTQTRTSDTTEGVSWFSGTCSGASGNGTTQTYVPGTVSSVQAGQNGSSIDIGYTPYSDSSAGAVFNANSAPLPDNPGIAYGYNMGGFNQLAGWNRIISPMGQTEMGLIGANLGELLSTPSIATPFAKLSKPAAASLGKLNGVSRSAAREALEEAGFKQRGITKGDYETWVHPDGSKVTIGPDGGVDRLPPSSAGKGWRYDSDGNQARPHTFPEERVN